MAAKRTTKKEVAPAAPRAARRRTAKRAAHPPPGDPSVDAASDEHSAAELIDGAGPGGETHQTADGGRG